MVPLGHQIRGQTTGPYETGLFRQHYLERVDRCLRFSPLLLYLPGLAGSLSDYSRDIDDGPGAFTQNPREL